MASHDPMSLLKEDHRRVREVLSQLGGEQLSTETLQELAQLVEAHTELEEELVYPAFHEAAADTEQAHLYFEALEEHGLVDNLLVEVQPGKLGPEVLAAKLKVTKDLLLHHLDEEEKTLFPAMRKLCSKQQLDELGQKLAARRSELEGTGQEAAEQEAESKERSSQSKPRSGGARAQAASGDRGGRVDINRASVEELQRIEGVDGVRAGRIVAYRDEHGPFQDWEDLDEVEGFDGRMVRAVRDQATLGR